MSVEINVLANDVSKLNVIDSTSVVITNQPLNGAATVHPTTGIITYTPNQGFEGTDTLFYTMKDAGGRLSNQAAVTVTVMGLGAPIANDDAFNAETNVAAQIDVLANDSDGTNTIDVTTVAITTQPTNGSASADGATGIVTYTSDPAFEGSDPFTYTVDDINNVTSNEATVTMTVAVAGGGFDAFFEIDNMFQGARTGALVNDSTTPKTFIDYQGNIINTGVGELVVEGARRFEPLLIETDNPVYTLKTLPAGDYVLQAAGTGDVVVTGGASFTLTAPGSQAFTSSGTNLIFVPDVTVTSWQLEDDYNNGVASEYLPCNVTPENGDLTFGARGRGLTTGGTISLDAGAPGYAWKMSDGTEFADQLTFSHGFGPELNALSLPAALVPFIKSLSFSNKMLTGTIPDLSAFTSNTVFNVFSNQLTGTIPDLSAFTSNTDFRIDGNQLTGTIPDLSAFTNNTVFYPYNNQLTGTIPDLSAFTNNISFYAYNNQLTGTIPDLSVFTNNTGFRLDGNQLTGTIPDLSAFTNNINFYIYNNQLTGTIPDLSVFTNNNLFYAYGNQLTGTIPDLSAFTNNTGFRLDGNQLTGYVPSVISANMKIVNFSGNDLTETAVNQIIIDFDTAALGTGLVLSLQGGTSAAPTGSGITAKSNLQGRGATVNTN